MKTPSAITEDKGLMSQWQKAVLIGGFAGLLSFGITLLDVIFGSITSSDLTALPETALERFAELQQNWLLGLYHLDLLNALNALVMLPVYFGLFAVHRHRRQPLAAFGLGLAAVGTTIFAANNAALPMLELSQDYQALSDQGQKLLLAAAGEAILAQGGHGSLGAFPGFLLLSVASVCFSLVMLQGGIFRHLTSWLGVIGNSLLLVYVVLVTFVPAIEKIAVLVAAPGGLLALAWILLLSLEMITMGKPTDYRHSQGVK